MSLMILFWSCTAGVVYTYAVYPAVIFAASRLCGTERRRTDLPDEKLPALSVLIAAHDEEEVIRERIHNILALDYPPSKLEIVIASDGSADRTTSIVREFDGRVVLFDYPVRRGKSATLNAAMAAVKGDIVLFSDANTSIDAKAARKLVRWFADPNIGAVCGKLEIVDPMTGANVDGVYWRFETFLKQCEDRLGALLGSNGAIYAIRKDVFAPIPPNTIVDDFVIPLRARIHHKCRLIYDREAVGREEAAPRVRDEFRRRVRIGAGGFQAIGLLWPLLSPRYGWTAFAFASHKICRWLCPLYMIGALLSSLALAPGSMLYAAMFLGQFAFYAVSLATLSLPGSAPWLRPLRLAAMFVSMNLALLLGLIRWLRGIQRGTWQRTARTASP